MDMMTEPALPGYILPAPPPYAYRHPPPARSSHSKPPPHTCGPKRNARHTTVVSHGAHAPVFGPAPVGCQCQTCGKFVLTEIHFKAGSVTWISIALLLLVGMWIGCFLIPLCVDSSKDVIHTCPSCSSQVGRFNRLQSED